MSTSFLITGATGKQGRSTITALLSHPAFSPKTHTIYALTRDASSAGAQRLAQRSPAIKMIAGDLNDPSAIFKALPSPPTGVFSVQLPGKKEVPQGVNLINAAAATGTIQRYVQASVERGGEGPTNVPHFKTKWEIENHLIKVAAEKGFSYTILRPVFFLDNLDWGFIGKVVATAWKNALKPERKLQVVDTRDIGEWAADALMGKAAKEGGASLDNAKISLAGDELTFEEANAIFKAETGKDIPITYGFFASLLLWASHDMSEMFKFFDKQGFATDMQEVQHSKRTVTDFRSWLHQSSHLDKQQ